MVVAGELSIQLGEQTHSLSAGSYVVIPGELPHYFWTVPAGESDAVIQVRRAGPADFLFIE